jgi:DNA polymerase-1
MGIQVIVIPGVEADDIIGSLAKQAQSQGLFTIISTGDKDLAQLVNANIILINTMSDTILDVSGVVEKFLVKPEQIVDYLSLIGDQVDNIPGVPKVGPKTAIKWLELYSDLDGIIANAENITGKVGEYLRATIHLLPLYKELTTIKTDVSLPYRLEQLLIQPQDESKLKSILHTLEFKKWLQELNGLIDSPLTVVNKEYSIILTQQSLQEWLEKLKQARLIAIDTETTSLDYLEAKIVGVSFAIESNKAAYIPVAHEYDGAPLQLDRNYVLANLKLILEDPNIAKVGHNLKYDMHIFANYGITLQGKLYDTMLESYVLDSVGSRHDLDTLAKKNLNYTTITFEQVAGKGAKQKNFSQVIIEEAGPYAAEDADITLQLHNVLYEQLQDIPALQEVFTSLEMALLPVLLTMERQGVLIDAKVLQQQSVVIAKRLLEIEQQVYSLAGEEFNLNSPKQLQEILYDKLHLPVLQKTPTGQPSTAEAVLQELALDFPLPKLILEYRSLSKLKSTYTDSLPLQINNTTGRIHTSYHQAVTTTGRLSSTDPNLQNIPVRTEEGRKIRSAFIASPGYKILSADYSQIELRIMAHLSEDPVLLSAFAKGIDIHKITAAEVFNVNVSDVSSEQRRRAKAINFGLLYGMSAFGLAKQLDIEKKDAEQYVDFYFAKFPMVKTFLDKTKEFATKHGYVETLFGRRLYLPDIRAKNMVQRRAAERAAINAPMQGGQADIIKKAMIDIHAWQKTSGINFHMLMQVHDELVFEVPIDQIAIVRSHLLQLMTNAAQLKVELVVSVGIGNNWEEAH